MLNWAIFYIIGTNLDFFRDNCQGFPGGSDGKESTCNGGDLSWIPGLGKSPGGGNGNPLQHSCLENPMDREAWRAISSMGSQSRTRLSNQAQHGRGLLALMLQLLLTQTAQFWVPSPSCLLPSEFTPICLCSFQCGTPSYK